MDLFKGKPQIFQEIFFVLGVSTIVILVFGIGVFVGEKRANYSFQWAEAYHKNFGGPGEGFLGQMPSVDFAAANGVFGQIIKIDLIDNPINRANLTIRSADGTEQLISICDKTTIRTQKKNLLFTDLKLFDKIVVIGGPNKAGQIQAQFIRVMPQPIQQNVYIFSRDIMSDYNTQEN